MSARTWRGFSRWLAANALSLIVALGGIGGVVWGVSRTSFAVESAVAANTVRIEKVEPIVLELQLDQVRKTTQLERLHADLRQVVDDLRRVAEDLRARGWP